MKVRAAISIVCVATALIVPAFAQDRTPARLNHESAPEITPPRIDERGAGETITSHSEPLSESMLSRSAATALFVNANLIRAHELAERALRHDHRDAEALFVLMEAAAMQADEATVLHAALHLCEIGGGARQDPRIRLAAARILESAANTPEFRAVIPGLQTLLANSSGNWPELNMALLDAAMDGVPTLDPEAIARASGTLTEWRMVGPMGRRPLPDTEQMSMFPNDDLAQASYDNHAVENFQFSDGIIRLPSYLSPRGTFYAVAHFASLAPGASTVRTEGGRQLEIYVDGKRLLLQDDGLRKTLAVASATFEIPAGPHRLLAKFAGAGAPLRIAISPSVSDTSAPVKAKRSVEELTYELASSAYADGQFKVAIAQINALPSASGSAALQFLFSAVLGPREFDGSRSSPGMEPLVVARAWSHRSRRGIGPVELSVGAPGRGCKVCQTCSGSQFQRRDGTGDFGRRNQRRREPCEFHNGSTPALVAAIGGASVMRNIRPRDDLLP